MFGWCGIILYTSRSVNDQQYYIRWCFPDNGGEDDLSGGTANEVFHTSYPQDVPIVQLRNEHQQENGEIITDSCLKIGGKLYHIECQSLDDETMAVRMVEYDFAIALEHRKKLMGDIA